MGHLGDTTAAPVQAAIEGAVNAIAAAGKPAGILSLADAASHAWFSRGCTFVGVASDGFILARQTERIVREFAAVKTSAPHTA